MKDKGNREGKSKFLLPTQSREIGYGVGSSQHEGGLKRHLEDRVVVRVDAQILEDKVQRRSWMAEGKIHYEIQGVEVTKDEYFSKNK